MSAALDVRSPLPIVLEDLPLRVNCDEVLRFQGYKKGVDVPDAVVLALFDEALALGESLIEPRVVYRAVSVTRQEPALIEAGRQRLRIPDIGRLWGSLEMVGAGICTAAGVSTATLSRKGFGLNSTGCEMGEGAMLLRETMTRMPSLVMSNRLLAKSSRRRMQPCEAG